MKQIFLKKIRFGGDDIYNVIIRKLLCIGAVGGTSRSAKATKKKRLPKRQSLNHAFLIKRLL